MNRKLLGILIVSGGLLIAAGVLSFVIVPFAHKVFAQSGGNCTGDPECSAGDICSNPYQRINGGTCIPNPNPKCIPRTTAETCSSNPNDATFGVLAADGCGGWVDCTGISGGSGGGDCADYGAISWSGACACVSDGF